MIREEEVIDMQQAAFLPFLSTAANHSYVQNYINSSSINISSLLQVDLVCAVNQHRSNHLPRHYDEAFQGDRHGQQQQSLQQCGSVLLLLLCMNAGGHGLRAVTSQLKV